jgi:hypothetical protein
MAIAADLGTRPFANSEQRSGESLRLSMPQLAPLAMARRTCQDVRQLVGSFRSEKSPEKNVLLPSSVAATLRNS